METPKNSPENVLFRIKLIHGALSAGLIIILILALLIPGIHTPLNEDIDLVTIGIIPVSGLLFFAAMISYKSRISKIDRETPVGVQLSLYQSAMIIRFALMELACLIPLGFLLISGEL